MNDNTIAIDESDLRLLSALQRQPDASQRDLAEAAGTSQNTCWRRLQRLEATGVIRGRELRVDLDALGLDLTVFVMIRTQHHAHDWAEAFARHVSALPEVIDCHRIGGEWDYLLKIVTSGMSGYDRFYQKLITGFSFAAVTGLFSMERIVDSRTPDLMRLAPRPAKSARRMG